MTDEQEIKVLNQIIDGSTEGLWMWDLEANKVIFNDRAYYLLNIEKDADSASFDTVLQQVLPKDRPQMVEAMSELQSRGSLYRLEHRIPLPDGNFRFCLCQGHVTETNDEGKPIRLAGAITDITYLKQTETALQESQARLHMALMGAGIGTYRWELKSQQMQWDTPLCRLLGVSDKPEFHTLNEFLAIVHPDDISVIKNAFEQPFQNKPSPQEFRIILPDGAIRWLQGRGQIFHDETDQTAYMVGVLTDITQTKEAEAILAESELLFRTLAASIPQLAWIADKDGNVYWYNQRWYDYTGTNLEEVEGWGWTKLLAPDYSDRVRQEIQHSWDTGEPWRGTFPLRGQNGEYHWFLSRALPIKDQQGQIIRWFGTHTDITELQEAKDALEQVNQQLAQSNRDLELFAGVISHDLKAPLRKISIFSKQLESEQEKLSFEGQDSLKRIKDAVDHLQILIGELLSWSQLQHEPFHIDDVALSEVLTKVLNTLKPTIDETRADIRIGQLDAVSGDEAQLEQLFQNLLENALKYQPPGQQPVVLIESQCDGSGKCTITVQDNGIGIKPEHQQHIFEPFTRLHGKASIYTGSGMGLAICKRIAERNGGDITVESTPMKGSVFKVHLLTPA